QVSFSLTRFGSITGQITDAASGVSISDAEVRLYDSDGAPVDGGSDYSDSHGEYEIQGLLSGTYFLVVSDNAYHDELYDNLPCEGGCDVTTGTPIAITIGSDPVVIDIALDRMGSISGRVTDAFTGKGLHDKHVALYDSQGNWVHTAYSNFVNGFYSFVGLAEGTYFLTTKDIGGYLDELFDDIPCEDGCDVTTGTPVIVTDGADTSDIDFALEPIPRFADVPVGYWARYWIRTLSDTGITAGCATNPLRYCPEDPVARNQMAVFLLKSKLSPDYTPPPALGMFNDVPIGDPFAPWIEELAARGITAGCSADPPLFCPNAPLTRNQMAKFLLKTLEGPVYSPPPAVGVFDDVPVDDPFAPWIEDLAARGITAGCSADPPLFCPNSPVSRAEMAVFLVKTFNLQVGGY
ncbi:MAG: carboxypeptidase regulatory-like domain-containing protein, partial [Acidobacteria bacterium]|nr:carboxypeptidase regulatory-like domain-containing protein [Acidobacteriota bacterium]